MFSGHNIEIKILKTVTQEVCGGETITLQEGESLTGYELHDGVNIECKSPEGNYHIVRLYEGSGEYMVTGN